VAAPSFTVTFLGTGSGTPTLARNLASVAIQRLGDLFLFDCGEAAQIQYRRAGLGFAPLRAIFVTHLHGDHVTGLPGLLMSLQLADRAEALTVYGPPGLREYVACNRRALGTGFSYALEIAEVPAAGELLRAPAYGIRCALLDHRVPCLGFRIEEAERPGRFDLQAARALGIPEGPLYGRLQRGETIHLPDGREITPGAVLGPPRAGATVVYCTDTRPCGAAVELADGADLLIHEGTFGEDQGRDARHKGHSTAADAARIALAARARRLAVTHISPRYQDVRPMLEEARAAFPETVIARDLMRLEVYPAGEEPGPE